MKASEKGGWKVGIMGMSRPSGYTYNPDGSWAHQRQISMNGKIDHFELPDHFQFGVFCDLKPKRLKI